MQDKDWKTFREFIDGVFNQYAKPPLNEAGARIMFEALRGLSMLEVIKGATSHVKNNRYMPPNAAAILEEAHGRPEDRARDAYGKVVQALRRIHSGESVRFDDPAIHWALVNGCGGWTGFAQMETADAQMVFEKFYCSAVRLGKTWGMDGVPDHLAGERETRGSVIYPWKPEQIIDVSAGTNDADVKKITA